MDASTLIFFFIGLVLLILGAEGLVRGAAKLASMIGISPLVIGLTVVAFGTSSPEMAVSVRAGLGGHPDVAFGNVVGSNIFNILFILGLSAAIRPVAVSSRLVRLDVPIMIGVSVLLLLCGLDEKLSRMEGFLFFSGLVAYTAFLVWQSHRDAAMVLAEARRERGARPGASFGLWLVQLGLILGGLICLGVGSRWLVDGAIALAESIGVSRLVIGITIVAAGTSLPEVATSVVASLRGQGDIAIGNLVGSNIFNILGVLGLSSLVSADGIHLSRAALNFDVPVMIAVAIACLPIFFTGYSVSRREGALFFAYYLAYTAYLILDSAKHEMVRLFSTVMMAFVIPLTLFALVIVTVRAIRKGRRQRQLSC